MCTLTNVLRAKKQKSLLAEVSKKIINNIVKIIMIFRVMGLLEDAHHVQHTLQY